MPYPSPITYPDELLFPGMAGNGSSVSVGDLVFNVYDSSGVLFVLEDVAGWGAPGSTIQATQRARSHGATTSEPFLKPRTMTLSGVIQTEDRALLAPAINTLKAAFTLDPFQMSVNEEGLVRSVTAQRQDDVIVKKLNAYEAEYSAQILAKDPLMYGDLVTAQTLLPSSTGGLVRPSTWPRTWTGVSNSGVIRLTNTGGEPSPVWLRVDGPLPAGGWGVTHIGKQKSLTFASSLSLSAGQFLTVDMQRREVLAQGQSARSGYVTSRGWFTLDPGANDLAFYAANYSTTALLTATTKPAWS